MASSHTSDHQKETCTLVEKKKKKQSKVFILSSLPGIHGVAQAGLKTSSFLIAVITGMSLASKN